LPLGRKRSEPRASSKSKTGDRTAHVANAIYDARNEPHQFVSVIDDETRERVGRMKAIEGMRSTLGNLVVSICRDGIKFRHAVGGDEYKAKGADITLSIAREFGFGKKPSEVADGLIAEIEIITSLNRLYRFERERRDLWRRLVEHACEVQPPEYKVTKFTEYFRVMATYAARKRAIEIGL
jgi:hypothetical protein